MREQEAITTDLNVSPNFEEQVLARFDALDARCTSITLRMADAVARLGELETTRHDVRLHGERALVELTEAKGALKGVKGKINFIADLVSDIKGGLNTSEDRMP